MRREHPLRHRDVRLTERPWPDGGTFNIAHTRTGPPGQHAVLVFPGGPGVGSIVPYRGLRKRAAGLGLQLVMIEHRGVGMSRADLTRDDVTIQAVLDDAAAVLDAEGIERVIVYGTSYGSYLAQGFGVRFPERVAGMILDSAMLSADDMAVSLDELNRLYWHGTEWTRRQAQMVHALVSGGVITGAEAGFPIQLLHEFGGTPLVDRALRLLRQGRGRRAWRWLRRLGQTEVMKPRPHLMEFDLVGEIAFRELGYAGPDGEWELDVRHLFRDVAHHFSPFEGEPFHLETEITHFDWPTVVISGERDLRTPRAVAERIVERIPDAVLLPVAAHGHSALDTQPGLALQVMRAMVDGIDPATLRQRPWRGRPGVVARLLTLRLVLASIGSRRPGTS